MSYSPEYYEEIEKEHALRASGQLENKDAYTKELEAALAKVTPSYNPLGKAGTLARAEAAKLTGTLDDKTRKELEAYVNNSAGQFDENVVSKARELLEYWTPTTITATSGSDARFAYESQLKAIDEQRKYAESLAEQARQDAIKNAYATYDRSLPTYGQNAERLANMGLSKSGYSDYLGGVAYSSMVGGVQDAHKTANDAIRDAYYNAELQKAQAADTLYNRQLAEEEAAYKKKVDQASILASVYSAVNNGEMDAETAKSILSAYGLSGAEGGNPGGNNTIVTDLTKTAEEQAYNNYASQITYATTDSEIDAFGLSKEDTDKLKADRNNAIVDNVKSNLQAEAQSGNVSLGNIEAIDTLYGNGGINKDTYQEVYFDKAVSFAKGIENLDDYQTAIEQIDGYVNQGKMTSENAEKVKQYISESVATVVPDNLYQFNESSNFVNPYSYITIDGKEYALSSMTGSEGGVNEVEKSLIEEVLGESKDGVVVIGDRAFYKADYAYGTRYYAIKKSTAEKILPLAKSNANTILPPTYIPIKE